MYVCAHLKKKMLHLLPKEIRGVFLNQHSHIHDDKSIQLTSFSLILYVKDAFAKGEVFLGNKNYGYSASSGLPAGTHCNGAFEYGITIQTPDRCFLFTCETESDQQDWLKHFNDIMSAQMSPQEYTSKTFIF